VPKIAARSSNETLTVVARPLPRSLPILSSLLSPFACLLSCVPSCLPSPCGVHRAVEMSMPPQQMVMGQPQVCPHACTGTDSHPHIRTPYAHTHKRIHAHTQTRTHTRINVTSVTTCVRKNLPTIHPPGIDFLFRLLQGAQRWARVGGGL